MRRSQENLSTLSSQDDDLSLMDNTSSCSSSPSTCSPAAIKKYKCAHCGRRFVRNEHLARHERIHTGEKPYTCSHSGCGLSFSRRDTLTIHLRLHVSGNPLASEQVASPQSPMSPITPLTPTVPILSVLGDEKKKLKKSSSSSSVNMVSGESSKVLKKRGRKPKQLPAPIQVEEAVAILNSLHSDDSTSCSSTTASPTSSICLPPPSQLTLPFPWEQQTQQAQQQQQHHQLTHLQIHLQSSLGLMWSDKVLPVPNLVSQSRSSLDQRFVSMFKLNL